jgi:hypothetical protein
MVEPSSRVAVCRSMPSYWSTSPLCDYSPLYRRQCRVAYGRVAREEGCYDCWHREQRQGCHGSPQSGRLAVPLPWYLVAGTISCLQMNSDDDGLYRYTGLGLVHYGYKAFIGQRRMHSPVHGICLFSLALHTGRTSVIDVMQRLPFSTPFQVDLYPIPSYYGTVLYPNLVVCHPTEILAYRLLLVV